MYKGIRNSLLDISLCQGFGISNVALHPQFFGMQQLTPKLECPHLHNSSSHTIK